jgi:predicted PurR-regulated permease PerM
MFAYWEGKKKLSKRRISQMYGRRRKSIFLAITYSALLILLIINFNPITQFLWKFIAAFNSFFVGIAIAFILNKPCMHIEKILNKKLLKRSSSSSLSRGIATTVTYLMFFMILILIVIIVIPQLIQSVQILLNNIGVYTDNLQQMANKVTDFLNIERIDLSSMVASFFIYLKKLQSSLTGLLPQIISITTGILLFIGNLFISFIFSIYILFGKEKLLGQCKRILSTYLPKNIFDKCYYVYNVTVDTFNQYIIGQLIGALIIAVLCMIGMFTLQIDYPLLIGVLVGITALIPVIGPYIGGIIAFFLLLMVNPVKAFWFVIFLLILYQFAANVIYPKVVGDRLGLPSLLILLSITIGGSLAGIMGIVFGLPITTVLYILIRDDLKNRV